MALTELAEAIREQIIKQREKEKELLESIAALSDYETAVAAADIYAAEKHAYSFDGYLHQLSKLQKVLAGGVPADAALEAIDTCLDEDSIISAYRFSQAGSE
jgi:regulator of protease activity HflC (stomatin/prohibitin superfamily)